MARKFRSDDTSSWGHKFGNFSQGDLVVSSGGDFLTQLAGDAINFTGNITELNGILGSARTFSGICMIHQTQGTNAGEYEFNYIIADGDTTPTFLYPLQNNYTTGAQVIFAKQYKTITINAGVTLTIGNWNGSYSGIGFFVCDTFINHGNIIGDARGFRGYPGEGAGDYVGRRGEGQTGNDAARTGTPQGVGAGAGGYSNNGPWDQGNGGGGGSNITSGQGGSGTGGGNNSNGPAGSPGLTLGDTELKTFTLGGAGGEGGNRNSSDSAGFGGYGAAALVGLARHFNNTDGYISLQGQYGGQHNFHSGGGGSGAGAPFLLKCWDAILGNISNKGGPHVHSNSTSTPGDANGGYGGDGLTHVDYLISVTGDTAPDPDATTRKDGSLADAGGASMYYS